MSTEVGGEKCVRNFGRETCSGNLTELSVYGRYSNVGALHAGKVCREG